MAMQIDGDFPGGNIIVEAVDGDTARVHQDLRDTSIDWFYWCMRVRGARGRTLRCKFTESTAIGVRGPAVSVNGGRTWTWLGRGVVDGNGFSYDLPADAADVRLSFGMPYQETHWLAFLEGLQNTAAFSLHTLCTTEKGRDAEYMLAGCLQTEPQHRAVITCRHHCCEMMANYALEGVVQWLLDDPCTEAQWLRDNCQLLVVPFVDKDGVEEGDQGKGREPRDHGRDYLDKSLFRTTAAIRELVPRWGEHNLHVGIDLHCPWISGLHNEEIYMVGSGRTDTAMEQRLFSDILETAASGPLPFSSEDYLPFGKAWNTGANYERGKGFSRWCAEIPGVALGTAFEIPYANARGAEVNQETASLFGKDLARALSLYLRRRS